MNQNAIKYVKYAIKQSFTGFISRTGLKRDKT